MHRLTKAGALNGARTALPWSLYADADSRADQAVCTSHLYEIDGNRLTCCDGAASVDSALSLIEIVFGSNVQAPVKVLLCVDRVRAREERQRVALQARRRYAIPSGRVCSKRAAALDSIASDACRIERACRFNALQSLPGFICNFRIFTVPTQAPFDQAGQRNVLKTFSSLWNVTRAANSYLRLMRDIA